MLRFVANFSILALACAGILCTAAEAQAERVNNFETFTVPWWGTEGSMRSRPSYRIAKMENGVYRLHYGIVPGRPMTDFIMPYWSVRSCFSIVNEPAELAHRPYVTYKMIGETKELHFIPRSGVELASMDGGEAFKIRNRSIASPEDTTTQDSESNPLMVECVFGVQKDNPVIPVAVRLTNTGTEPLEDVQAAIYYEQNFNWGDFGVAGQNGYQALTAPAEGETSAFYAYSAGMQRGYEFSAGTNCVLAYTLQEEMNAWSVSAKSGIKRLGPGEAFTMSYVLRVLDGKPDTPLTVPETPPAALLDIDFERIQPSDSKGATIKNEGRILIRDVIAGMSQPKVRGINLRDSFPKSLETLELLEDWGCNLVITGIGQPEETAQLIEAGHKRGMEMFVAGRGNYREGLPDFEALYEKPLLPLQQPDSFGQDEDHYYWFAIKPTRGFEADFGKPMAMATHDEMVRYWAGCFVEKWKQIQANIRPHAKRDNVWFYAPFPSIANVEPLDSYDLFLKPFAEFGNSLTVFPFYYGVEYNQAEYMARRWKDAGAERVVFLPMTGFLVRPTQMMKVITSSRRGQADGVCGFNFPVLDEKPEDAWQWKSLLLAAQANFPTPELDAFIFMEDSFDLVEALAFSDIVIESIDADVDEFAKQLRDLVPGKVYLQEEAPKAPADKPFQVVVGRIAPIGWGNSIQLPEELRTQSKGYIEGIRGKRVTINGTDATGVQHAVKLFLRFAELAKAEAAGAKIQSGN